MNLLTPYMVLGTVTDTALIVLLVILGVVTLLIVALFNGRHPSQVVLDRYCAEHQLDDAGIALDVLAELDECLRREDYKTAHEYMLSHTNWFFLHRMYLPTDFSNYWLMLRNRVNRMLTVYHWPQDWAHRDLQRLREEALRLIEKACVALGGMPLEEQLNEEHARAVEEELQSMRSISAPSERNLSSMDS